MNTDALTVNPITVGELIRGALSDLGRFGFDRIADLIDPASKFATYFNTNRLMYDSGYGLHKAFLQHNSPAVDENQRVEFREEWPKWRHACSEYSIPFTSVFSASNIIDTIVAGRREAMDKIWRQIEPELPPVGFEDGYTFVVCGLRGNFLRESVLRESVFQAPSQPTNITRIFIDVTWMPVWYKIVPKKGSEA